MHNAQIGRIDIGDLARAVDDADAVLHGLQDHLQTLLHQRVLMQQQIHLMDIAWRIHLEITLEEANHLIDSLPPLIALRGHEHRIPAGNLERYELHEAVHLTALTALAAQK